MHWIENALANVNLEVLNDILVWTIHTLEMFDLDIGTGNSTFERIIPIDGFSDAIFLLAYFIIIAVTAVKLWITMMSPFDTAEAPGAIVVRFSAAIAGTMLSQKIFDLFQGAFNTIYQKFKAVYTGITDDYKNLPWNEYSEEIDTDTISSAGEEESSGVVGGIKDFFSKLDRKTGLGSNTDIDPKTNGAAQKATEEASGSNAFNLFGGDSLIKPDTPEAAANASLGVLLLELIIGCTLLISFFRLILEVYERYVLVGLMYYTAPLAFASIVSTGAKIFRSWFQMLISQFILLCANLVFIGGFIGAWYKIMEPVPDQGYVFESEQQYFTTMFALIGWLVIGQKFDQHLKGLGLSTAQTGAGLMGALAGGAVMARAAIGTAGSLAGGAHKAAMGQTMAQKAYHKGEGLPGMLPGAGKDAGGKSIGDKINDGIQASGKSGQKTPDGTNDNMQISGKPGQQIPGSRGSAPRTEGKTFDEAMNNAIRGSGKEGDSGTPIPSYKDPEARAGFDSEGIDWQESKAIPGAVEGYDSATNTTLTVGQDAASNARLEELYGSKDGQYGGQLDATSVNGQVMYIHGATGRHVGEEIPVKREGAGPREQKNLIDRKNEKD